MAPAPNQRPLQAGAFVMLAISAIDGAIKTIEYFAGTPLWKIMLATGLFVLLLDVLLYDRTTIGSYARDTTFWLLDGLKMAFRQIWNFVVRLRTPR